MEFNLKDLQKKELEILKSVTEVCEKLHIQYFLYYGTFLGAVRHKGFIPWDDDIDICMTRENYERFLKEAPGVLPKHLMIQHYTTERNTNNIFIKVRDKNTVFIENDNEDLDICHGVFLDIFPVDRITENPRIQSKEFQRRIFFGKVVSCYSKACVKTIVGAPRRCVAYLMHYSFCKLIPKYRLMEWEDTRRKKLHQLGGAFYLRDSQYDKGCGVYSEIEDLTPYEFEGCSFMGPKDFNSVLSALYGQYMQIPPKEKQRTHKPLKINLECGKGG